MKTQKQMLAKKYINNFCDVLKKINFDDVSKLKHAISKSIKEKKNIYICGNGGSAAISNHFHCDFLNQVSRRSKIKPQIYSLVSNIEIFSAVANDYKYEDVFYYQCKNYMKKGDILLVISSSGNSKNVIKAAKYAKKIGCKVFSIIGFNGGLIKKISNCSVHIKANDYGMIEDATQIIMHYFAKETKN